MKRQDSILSWVLGITLAAIVVFGVALAPSLGQLYREREFAEDVGEFVKSPTTRQLRDDEMRSRLQALARGQGFYLSFDNVFIRYGKGEPPATPGKGHHVGDPGYPELIGYTLPVELPIFGVFDYPTLAVRIFSVTREPVVRLSE